MGNLKSGDAIPEERDAILMKYGGFSRERDAILMKYGGFSRERDAILREWDGILINYGGFLMEREGLSGCESDEKSKDIRCINKCYKCTESEPLPISPSVKQKYVSNHYHDK